MTTILRKPLLGLFLVAAITGVAASAGHAEEKTFNAFAPIATSGQMLQTGSNTVSFAGVATGIMLVESDQGLANAGNVSCTINLEMLAVEDRTNGNGRCSVIGSLGSRLYGSYTCQGTIGFGCRGEFVVDGGTGEFAEARGAGEFALRSMVAETAFSNPPAERSSSGDGIVIWRNLKVSTSSPAPAEN